MKKILIPVSVILLIVCVILLNKEESEGDIKDANIENTSLNASSIKKGKEAVNVTPYNEVKNHLDPELRYPPRFLQENGVFANDPSNPSDLPEEAELLKDKSIPEDKAVEYIDNIITSFIGIANRGAAPNGDHNVEITNALLGKNYLGVAYLTDDHPRIDEHGQLTDKWDIPYYFHVLSADKIEIRSAGEDKIMYTDDDIILEKE